MAARARFCRDDGTDNRVVQAPACRWGRGDAGIFAATTEHVRGSPQPGGGSVNAFSCRICRSTEHDQVLDYGEVVPADSFIPAGQPTDEESRYPLTLVVCRQCFHVQILEILDPALLFVDYVWETGIPASIHRYCRELADAVLARAGASSPPSVFEIASNDGTLLKEFRSRGSRLLGVDPARNIARKAMDAGIPTIADFFSERVAHQVLAEHGQWDVLIARNVLAHVADLHGLMAGLRLPLAPRGIAVIEVPH